MRFLWLPQRRPAPPDGFLYAANLLSYFSRNPPLRRHDSRMSDNLFYLRRATLLYGAYDVPHSYGLRGAAQGGIMTE